MITNNKNINNAKEKTYTEGTFERSKGIAKKVQYNGEDALSIRGRSQSDKDDARRIAKEKIKNPETNASLQSANDYNEMVGLPMVTEHKYKKSDALIQPQIAGVYEKLKGIDSPDYKEGTLQKTIYNQYKRAYPEIFKKYKIKNYKDLVQKAYEQLIYEVQKQYDTLPIKVSFHEGNKNYENNLEMLDDVHNFGHLWVYKGGDDHPRLGSRTIDSEGLTANDKFRAVHDYYGHSVEGYQFGKDGEENAWVEHSKMLTPLSQWALSSETRGQNSWVNYSGANTEVLQTIKIASNLKKEGLKIGDKKMVDDGQELLDKVYDNFIFAEQKAIILPMQYTTTSKYHNVVIKDIPQQLDISNRFENGGELELNNPQVGNLIDFGDGLERIIAIQTYPNGKTYIQSVMADGSDDRRNLYNIEEWNDVVSKQDLYKARADENLAYRKERERLNLEIQQKQLEQKKEYEDVDGFADKLTPIQRGKVLEYLNKSFSDNIRVKDKIRGIVNNAFIKDRNGKPEIRYTEDGSTYIIGNKYQTKTSIDYLNYLKGLNKYKQGGTINTNYMDEIKFNQLPHIDTLKNGDKILIRESVFVGDMEKPKHKGDRYVHCEVMGNGGMTNSLNLKVLNSVGANTLRVGQGIVRPISNVLSNGRKMIVEPIAKVTPSFKEGGLNPDSKEVKQYFAHDSGNAGGVLVGKRHSEGGIKAINNGTGQPIEMEGGEVVITRGAVSNPKKYEFNGKEMTTREILSSLNVDGGGVSFAEGGDVPEKMNCGCNEMKFGGNTMTTQDFVKRSESEFQEERLKNGIAKERHDHYDTLSKLNSGTITIEQALREIAQKEMKLDSKYPFGE